MARELQARGFEQSAYERTDQNWMCGWAATGRPCPLGPESNGRCVVTHECSPVRSGDRWQCTRAEADGGACEQGPLSGGTCCNPIQRCQPVRSLRARRGRLARWVAGGALAWLVLAVSGSDGRDVVSPGPVGSQHGPIEDRCGECHVAGASGPAGWFGAAFSGTDGHSESALCQNCHDLGGSGTLPHGVETADLAVLTEEASEFDGGGGLMVMLAGLGPGPPTSDDGGLACATCHQEHAGRNAALTELTNEQCQICHQRKFASFEDGHPGFTQYPYLRRTRIRFNHATHREDHFPQEGDDFTCRGCHNPDRQGQVMLVAGFEENCQSCHASDVDVPDGIPFLQLPGIDTDALSEAGVGIGEWPSFADIDQDSAFSPYLRVMLASSPENAAAFDALPNTPDELIFAELGTDEDEARAVGQLVWAIKDLLHKLVTERQPALKEHLDSGLRRMMSETELAELSASFDFDLLARAARDWFPNLSSELTGQRLHRVRNEGAGYSLSSHTTRLVDSSSLSASDPVWGWLIDPDSVAIRYRPRGHADALMKSWLDVAVRPESLANSGAMEFAFASLTSPESNGKCAKCHSVDATPDLRSVNWHQKRRDQRERGFTRYMHRPHLIQPELASCVACHAMNPDEPLIAQREAASGSRNAEEVSDEPVVEAAVDRADQAADADSDTVAGDADTDVAVDMDSDTGLDTEADPEPEVAEAEPAPEPERDSAAEYAVGFSDGNHDPIVFGSNFGPLDRETCSTCHHSGRGGATNSCLNCHDYHVHPAMLKGVQAHLGRPTEDSNEAVE